MTAVTEQLANARKAVRGMLHLTSETCSRVLNDLADLLVDETPNLLAANIEDLNRMEQHDPRYDRLKLTPERVASMAGEVRKVAQLPMPLGRVLELRTLENGLELKKVSVPLGVVGVIYESRPNVTIDVFALCIRSGNVAVLKGGADAAHTNQKLIDLVHRVLARYGLSTALVQLLPPSRQAAEALMQAVGLVDVLIPRGSQQLIDAVRAQSKVPVIETGAGIVHTYLDATAPDGMASAIVHNAKTRRVSVCNALDCLIVHQEKLSALAQIVAPLAQQGVELYADARAFQALLGHYPPPLLFAAEEADFGREFLSLKMAVKSVDSFDEALDHIDAFGSKHSEAIVTSDAKQMDRFLNEVDAAAVYVNASTAFTDGAQFGMGAEIGISTQKLHARGPMGLAELTGYKWQIVGSGQIRANG